MRLASPSTRPGASTGTDRVTLGVIGGGQLGRMLALAAAPLDIDLLVLDPTPDCPASVAARQIRGSLDDPKAIRKLAQSSDLITFEIEHCDVEALEAIAREGVPVRPGPHVLRTVSDKLLQRRTLAAAGLPVPKFAALDVPEIDTPGEMVFSEFSRSFNDLGAVQKARFGGYDGRGVAMVKEGVLSRISDATKQDYVPCVDSSLPLSVSSYLEERVPIATEVSVIVARATDGSTAVYDPVEMVMDPRLHLLDIAIAPARISTNLSTRCEEVARAAAETMDVVGLLAVELFLTPDGRVLINEVAPRPHNSGHHTIEACVTNQFEQQLRAVCGLPLGSPRLLRPTALRNIIVPPGFDTAGERSYPPVESLVRALAIEEIHLHLYGKHSARPGRKMGHFTAGGSSISETLSRLETAAQLLGTRVEE